jgi:hypothetical protein
MPVQKEIVNQKEIYNTALIDRQLPTISYERHQGDDAYKGKVIGITVSGDTVGEAYTVFEKVKCLVDKDTDSSDKERA